MRLFPVHEIRKNIPLNPLWTLTVPGHSPLPYPVPACIESHPAFSSYRGRACYETGFHAGGNVKLTFQGVSHTAFVYVDGKCLGSHYGAYGEFSFLLKDLVPGEHTLRVETDNSFSEASALHVENDYYSYGGITRPVILEQVNRVMIDYIHVTPYLVSVEGTKQWHARVQVSLTSLSAEDTTYMLSLEAAEGFHQFEPAMISGSSTVVLEKDFSYEQVTPYTPENPKLYYVTARLSEKADSCFILTDDFTDRFGFREIKVEGRDILWNGKKIKLHGFNRHEDYAEFGCAVPFQAMYRDISLLKDLHANCVRTCHYPNDEAFLDLCDEMGIMVWEESHARGLSLEQMQNPNFDEQSRICIQEMITSHYNHPSIFIWGILNECASHTDYGRNCYEKQFAQIKELDSSRPTTFASCHFDDDICLDLPDVVSFNIYPKWYHNTPCSEYLHLQQEYINTHGGKDKPLIISEIGAGAIYGFRSNTHAKWTEEYQEEALSEQLLAVLSNTDCSGVFIWQFADTRVDNGSFYARPKSQNNKGVVDTYRREKLSYRVVKELFKSAGQADEL